MIIRGKLRSFFCKTWGCLGDSLQECKNQKCHNFDVRPVDDKVPGETTVSWEFVVFLLLGSSPSTKIQ